MLGHRRKKASAKNALRQFAKVAQGVVFVALAFFLVWLFINSLGSEPKTPRVQVPSVDYLLDTSADMPQQSCLLGDFQQCLDTRSNIDFLYEDEPEIVIEEAEPKDYAEEEFRESLAASVFYQKLAELEAADKFEPAESLADVEDVTEKYPEETLDKIYEEELPNDVIVEDSEETPISPELLAAGYHVYTNHKNIKSLNVRPSYKPAYFGEEPVIAVVIDDMGISLKRTADITSLQAPLTASFLTYGRALDQQVEKARASGQEIMVHTPMEPHSNANLAPDTLTTQMKVEEIKTGLTAMLDKFHDVKGINNHMGSKLTEDKERMNAVMEVLKQRDLFFLDSKTTAFSVAKKAARQNGVAYATRHVFLDNENRVDYILKQLSIAERIARRNGYAVAIGHPKSGTYLALKEWLPTLGDKKIKLVHLSDIVKVLRESHI